MGPKIRFRPNVAAILQNPEGRILVAERRFIPNAWQFPQGGVDDGENLEQALRRELMEEIGVPPTAYDVVRVQGGYRYRFPVGRPRRYDGQEQTYYLCRFLGDDSLIRLDVAQPEFRAWKWIAPDEFEVGWLPPFKREVYEKVMQDFFGVPLRETPGVKQGPPRLRSGRKRHGGGGKGNRAPS
ncbi:MAG: NUDIX domain-containing protein [Verrucomicrobiales bacterium]